MSQRHHTNRRKTYGRRQHELRQRSDRRAFPELIDGTWDDQQPEQQADPFAFLDPRGARIRFALGD